MNSVRVIEADWNEAGHASAILQLVDMYAADPMGGGQPLSSYARQNLIQGLRRHPTTIVFLALSDEKPVGIAVCFMGFSTFSAKPLLNIHDFAVAPEFRGRGIGKAILETVARKARALGCCKLTLEVRADNRAAQKVYRDFGFDRGQYAKESGGTLFFTKDLD